MKRAQILLMADQGATDQQMADALPAGASTVYRTRGRFVEGGLGHALSEAPRSGGSRMLWRCWWRRRARSPPRGKRWTLELLAGQMIRLTEHDSISPDTIGRRLREHALKPWQKRMWCIPNVTPDFVARMEDVLDLYAEEEPAHAVG
jgi:hypothetical protein